MSTSYSRSRRTARGQLAAMSNGRSASVYRTRSPVALAKPVFIEPPSLRLRSWWMTRTWRSAAASVSAISGVRSVEASSTIRSARSRRSRRRRASPRTPGGRRRAARSMYCSSFHIGIEDRQHRRTLARRRVTRSEGTGSTGPSVGRVARRAGAFGARAGRYRRRPWRRPTPATPPPPPPPPTADPPPVARRRTPDPASSRRRLAAWRSAVDVGRSWSSRASAVWKASRAARRRHVVARTRRRAAADRRHAAPVRRRR